MLHLITSTSCNAGLGMQEKPRAIFEIRTDYRNCHIWAEVALILSFYHRGQIGLVFALPAVVSEIRTDFQNCHISARNLEFDKFLDLA